MDSEQGGNAPKRIEIVSIKLPNDAEVLVRAEVVDASGDVGLPEFFDLSIVKNTISGVASALQGALETAKPSKAAIEVGFEFAIKAGKLTAMLVDGESKATLKVALEWAKKEP